MNIEEFQNMANMKNLMIGTFLSILVMVFLGIAFLTPSADQINALTNPIVVRNASVLVGAVNTSTQLTLGRDLLTTIRIFNNSAPTQTLENNGTYLTQTLGSDGLQHIYLFVNHTGAKFTGQRLNVSYTANPDGFVDTASSSLLSTIVLFLVVGLLIGVIVTVMKSSAYQNIIGGNR